MRACQVKAVARHQRHCVAGRRVAAETAGNLTRRLPVKVLQQFGHGQGFPHACPSLITVGGRMSIGGDLMHSDSAVIRVLTCASSSSAMVLLTAITAPLPLRWSMYGPTITAGETRRPVSETM